MKIYTGNAEEYVAVCTGLCGEVEPERLGPRAPVSRISLYRAIRNLRDAHVLLKHKYEDGRTFLRLSSLGSPGYLDSISPAVTANARKVVREDIKYSGSRDVRLRERATYEFYFSCFDKGIAINGITVEHRRRELNSKVPAPATSGASIFLDDGTPLPLEAIAKTIGKDYTGLFTKKIMKNLEEDGLSKAGTRNSRTAGTLFLSGQPYQVYPVYSATGSAWKPEAELNITNYISGTLERNSPYFSGKNAVISNKCLLLLPNKEEASAFLTINDKNVRIDPCAMYEQSYVRPAFSLEEAFLKLYGTPEWERKMTEVFFPCSPAHGIEDAYLEDGTEVYNFVGCNINRIRETFPRINGADIKTVILAETWMTESLHEIFTKENVEIVEITENDISLIADAVSKA